jgi:hypothetical protein
VTRWSFHIDGEIVDQKSAEEWVALCRKISDFFYSLPHEERAMVRQLGYQTGGPIQTAVYGDKK